MFLKAVELVACASDWSALDAMLSRPEFGELEGVLFGGRLRTVPTSLRQSAKTLLSEQLPGARSRGVRVSVDMNLCG